MMSNIKDIQDSSEKCETTFDMECSDTKKKSETTDCSNIEHSKPAENSSNGPQKYEVINGAYYYTDENTNVRYKFDNDSQSWITVTTNDTSAETVESSNKDKVEVDDEGRTYYHAEGRYLCRDPTGNVYYMDDKNEWVLWNTDTANTNESNAANDADTKWYFYKGEDAFYRDRTTNTVYKLNKASNEWEISKVSNKHPKKRKAQFHNPDEEFDSTDSSNDSNLDENVDSDDDLLKTGKAPPGYRNDPNISYDGETYLKKDPTDNMLYEWDALRRAWFPKIDEDFMAQYQMTYGFNPDGTKNENPVKYDDDIDDDFEEEIAKKKAEEEQNQEEKKKKKAGWFETDDKHNTKVYVSNLPNDMDQQEFVDLMQKCGLVLKDPETGEYKVKLYKDSEGNFKGDALCTYIKVESVDLALQILDGARVGARHQAMKVERAKFEMKGEYNAALKPKKKRKKILDKLQKKQEKLFAWAPEPLRGQRGKYDNVVVIKNAFDPKEFEEHAEKILTHQETLRAQCTSFGSIKKLELFDRHPEGVLKVVFHEPEAADLCLASMNNRLYGSRTLSVTVWDGVEKFKIEETKEEEEARLKKWEEFLSKGGSAPKT